MAGPRTKQPSTLAAAVRDRWPSGRAGYVLLGLIFAGVVLRLVAVASWWPTTPTLDDGYQLYAESNPFTDPQHPGGYPLILAGLGLVTHEVAVPVLLQHLGGIASALLLFAATRRVAASAWAGLLPAAIVLLNPDQVFLEHAIMSESWSVLTTSIGLYAVVRAFDQPDPWWRWPVLAGMALGLGVPIRSAGLLLIPVAVLVLLLCRERPLRGWGEHWRAPAATAVAAAAVLFAFATANAAFGERFGIGPSPGWYLYGRVAQFADCSEFTPPAGTESLCEERPADQRPGAFYYLFDPEAPAPSRFGAFGEQDGLVGEWAGRAVRAQPGDFLAAAWEYLRGYYVPSAKPEGGGELDPQLDFTRENYVFVPAIEQGLEEFYNDFTLHERRAGLEFLRGWHHVTRFGATMLSITTALALIGLVVGTRRSRVGVLLFGVGGLALLLAPVLTGNYVGRYTVPMAGPLFAASAITLVALWRRLGGGRRAAGQPPEPEAGDGTVAQT